MNSTFLQKINLGWVAKRIANSGQSLKPIASGWVGDQS